MELRNRGNGDLVRKSARNGRCSRPSYHLICSPERLVVSLVYEEFMLESACSDNYMMRGLLSYLIACQLLALPIPLMGFECPTTLTELQAIKEARFNSSDPYLLRFLRNDLDEIENCKAKNNLTSRLMTEPSVLKCVTDFHNAIVAMELVKEISSNELEGTNKLLNVPPEKYLRLLKERGVGALPEPLSEIGFLKELLSGANSEAKLRSMFKRASKSYPNLQAVKYKSQVIQDVLVIRSTSKTKEIFVLIGMQENGETASSFDVLTVSKDPAKARPQVYFNEIQFSDVLKWKSEEDRRVLSLTEKELSDLTYRHQEKNFGSCISCHRTALMPIIPRPGTKIDLTPRPSRDSLEEINASVRANADAEIAFTSIKKLGPPIGPINPKHRTDDFIRRCAGQYLSEIEIKTVKNSMNCVQCHNGAITGILSFPLFFQDHRNVSIAAHFVEIGHMPPPWKAGTMDNQLSPKVRKAVSECLKIEYYGVPSENKEWKFKGLFFEDFDKYPCDSGLTEATGACLRCESQVKPVELEKLPIPPLRNGVRKD